MSRKTSLISACFVLCAAAGAVCGGEKTITRKDLGFQITVPESHDINTGGANSVSYLMATSRDAELLTSVYVYDAKDGETISSLFTNPEYRHLLQGRTVTAISIASLNGIQALVLDTDCKDPQMDASHWRGYFVVAGKRSYYIMISASKAD